MKEDIISEEGTEFKEEEPADGGLLFESTMGFSPAQTPSRRELFSEIDMSLCSVMYESDAVLTRFQLEQLLEKVYLLSESFHNQSAVVGLPKSFLRSVLDVVEDVDKGVTLDQIDTLLHSILVELLAKESHCFSDLEKILFIRYSLSQKSIRAHDKHLFVIREKEMDLAKSELIDQERRIVELAELLTAKEKETQLCLDEKAELNLLIQQLKEKVSDLGAQSNSLLGQLSEEKDRYSSLESEFNLYKTVAERNIKRYEDLIQDKEKDIEDLNRKISSMHKSDSDKSTARLKNTINEMRKREDDILLNLEKKRMEDRKWYGNQIMILETDRDMYYNQCCTLQDELAGIHQEYERCLKDKDEAIDEMRKKLEEVVSSVKSREQNSEAKKNKSSDSVDKVEKRDRDIKELQEELLAIEVRDDSAWKQLTDLLTAMQKKMEEAKNISVLSRQILFNDTTGSPDKASRSMDRRVLFSPKLTDLDLLNSSNASQEENDDQNPLEIRHQLSPIVLSNHGESALLSPMSHLVDKEYNRKYNQAVQDLETKLEELQSENQLLRSKLDVLNDELLERTEKLHILEEEHLQASQASSNASHEEEDSKTHKDSYMRIKRREYEALLCESRELQERYHQKFSRYKKEIGSLQAQLDSFARERSSYERRLASLLDEKQETDLKLYMVRNQ